MIEEIATILDQAKRRLVSLISERNIMIAPQVSYKNGYPTKQTHGV